MPNSTHSSKTNLLHSSAYRSAPTQTPTNEAKEGTRDSEVEQEFEMDDAEIVGEGGEL